MPVLKQELFKSEGSMSSWLKLYYISLHTCLYIIHVRTSYLTIPCIQLQSCSYHLNSFIAHIVPGRIGNWNASNLFSHSWLTHTYLARNDFSRASSCYHYSLARSRIFTDLKNLGKNVDSNLKCVGAAVYGHPNSSYIVVCRFHYISTVFIQIEAQVSISNQWFLTQHLN